MEAIVNFLRESSEKYSDLLLIFKSPKRFLWKIRSEETLQNLWRLFIYFLTLETITVLVLGLKISKILLENPFLLVGAAIADFFLSLVAFLPFFFYLKFRRMKKPLRLSVNTLVLLRLFFLLIFYLAMCFYVLTEAFAFYFFYSWFAFAFLAVMPSLFVIAIPSRKLVRSVLSGAVLTFCFLLTVAATSWILVKSIHDPEVLIKYNGLTDFVLVEQLEVGEALRDRMSTAVYDPQIADIKNGALKTASSDIMTTALARLRDFQSEIEKQKSEAIFLSTRSLVEKFEDSAQLVAKYYLALQQFSFKYRDGVLASEQIDFLKELKKIYDDRDVKAILVSINSLIDIQKDAARRKDFLFVYLY